MAEWQPIETAPKGQAVLFYFPDYGSRNRLGPMMKVGMLSDLSVRQPTHWMPLPEPPQ